MSDEEWIAQMRDVVREAVRKRLSQLSLCEMASLDRIEALVRALCAALAAVAFEVWAEVLTQAAINAATACPGCGHDRTCRVTDQRWRDAGPFDAATLGAPQGLAA